MSDAVPADAVKPPAASTLKTSQISTVTHIVAATKSKKNKKKKGAKNKANGDQSTSTPAEPTADDGAEQESPVSAFPSFNELV